MNSLLLWLALVCLGLFYLQTLQHDVSGISPPFTRQGITDAPSDWLDAKYNAVSGYNDSNIQEISYSSDGKFLNATLWLSSKFEERPIDYIPAYAMLVDIDSDLSTGNGGFEYEAGIHWNNDSKTWSYYVQERAGDSRVLNETLIRDYKGFFDRNQSHVNLFLNLEPMGFPDHYSVEFVAAYNGIKNGAYYYVEDYSDYISIPPPKFSLSTEPKSILIRPNEEKQMQFHINATSYTLANDVSLTSEKVKGIKLTFDPNKISLASNGVSQSLIKIKVEENLPSQTYLIPISINFVSNREYRKRTSKVYAT